MKEIKMYINIQELKELGFSKRKTAKALCISRDTVKTYWNLTPDEYVTKSQRIRKRSKLSKYEPIILNWLSSFPSMTTAQVYDWLLEHYKVDVSERTVRRYVSILREENGIERTSQPRDYESVDELPMGYQMQVDFGEKSMRTPDGQYVKVHFIGAVLSHSRYKWGYFLDRPFCSVDLVRCLDMCFAELGGVAHELVFDQDSIVAVNENYGDIIYTCEFEKYRQRLGLNIRLCRKADPESKGKVESVVKYVKTNFLPNRMYMGLDVLNCSFTEWLVRTGNGKVHGTTKKVPAEVFELERTHLRPILFAEDISSDESIYRKVRKDNTILYESNRYSLPLGTYNKEKEVKIESAEDKLVIWQAFGDYIIAEHSLCHGKGQLIKNTNHQRNTEQGIDELFSLMSNQLDGLCDDFLSEIRKRKSRYVRDQYGLIDTLIQKKGVSSVITAIEYCRKHEIFSATDLRDTIEYLENQVKSGESPKQTVIVMPITNPAAVAVITQKRSIGAYAGIGGDLS